MEEQEGRFPHLKTPDGRPWRELLAKVYHESSKELQVCSLKTGGRSCAHTKERRRGGEGSILNSKSEFNRCRIPRLVLEEIDEEQADELREALELLEQCEKAWENQKTKDRGEELREARNKVAKIKERVTSKKREQEQPQEGANKSRRKKLKHSIEAEGWGQEHTGSTQRE